MKRALELIKSVLICICAGLIIGFFTMAGIWVFSKNKPNAQDCLKILQIASGAGITLVAAIKIIRAAAEARPISRAIALSQNDSTCDEAFEIIKERIKKANDPEKKNTYLLILSAIYSENSRYEQAVNTLDSIDFTRLPSELSQEYFNSYMYTYIMQGDLENASKVKSSAEPYFSQPAPSLLHTLGVYEYANGEYGKARSYLLRSKTADSSDRNVCDCDLYLTLCALKEGRLKEARALYTEAEQTAVTSSEHRDLEKLSRLIERVEAKNRKNDEIQAEINTETEPDTDTDTTAKEENSDK